MQTIIMYKVVWVNELGEIEERNYQNESDARNFCKKQTEFATF